MDDLQYGDVADRFGIDATTGTLNPDPVDTIHLEAYDEDVQTYLTDVEQLGRALPELTAAGEIRSAIHDLETPPDDVYEEIDAPDRNRLCQLYGFLASAYVHQDQDDTVDTLPASVARPLYRCSDELDRPPILSYDMYMLNNVIAPGEEGADTPGQLDVRQTFTTLNDEEWFIKVHAAIEAASGSAIQVLPYMQQAVADDDPETVYAGLQQVNTGLDDIVSVMRQMPEKNDPSAFANEYRPYLNGFQDIVYEGVDAFGGEPQTFRGGSGAQSTVFPAFDAAFGIDHDETALVSHLDDLHEYMPPQHREFLDRLMEYPDITGHVEDAMEDTHLPLATVHDDCVRTLIAFRFIHWQQVKTYITEETGDMTGTGDTDYSAFLPDMIAATEDQLIGEPADNYWEYMEEFSGR